MPEYRTYTVPIEELGKLSGKESQPLTELDLENTSRTDDEIIHDPYKRETWSRGVEFLFSCIAM